MRGFFPASQLAVTKAPPPLRPQCGACGLLKTCDTPKMLVSGEGKRKILIIGEAPGKIEDEKGIQFAGKSGKKLEATLDDFGIDMREDCWLTNSLICRPPKNATPTDAEIGYCRPNLVEAIRKLKPEIIIPVGGPAVKSLLGMGLWTEDVGSISRWAGWRIPSTKLNAWICPTFHPSYILRDSSEHRGGIAEIFFRKHLRAAAKLKRKPFKTIPNYLAEVECITDVNQAAKILREMIRGGGNVAFDYETNMLKPDRDDAAVASCSVCWNGVRTIAYPWMGAAIDATRDLIYSPLGKIASNIKFEDRWTRKLFGKRVRNWVWDTMLNAHILDNRPDITSIKFQSFIYLGTETYDGHIKPFLKAKKDEPVNKIFREIDLHQLLKYNGLDSLFEYRVAELQRSDLHLPPWKK